MNVRTLGRTGLRVAEIGFGAWAVGGNSYGTTDDRESLAAIRRSIDLGATLIDTADIYGFGHSEELVAKAIRGRRQDLLLATKGGWNFYGPNRQVRRDFSAGHIRYACEQSLKRLSTDSIDLYQLHNPTADQIRDFQTYQVLDALKREGKIRFYGISIHLAQEGLNGLEVGKADTIQVVYNLIEQWARRDLFEKAAQLNIGILAREPLACGLLTGKYTADHEFPKNDHRRGMSRDGLRCELERARKFDPFFKSGSGTRVQRALAFVIGEPAVSVVIPGAKTVAQVEDNFGSARLALSPQELADAHHLSGEDPLLAGQQAAE